MLKHSLTVKKETYFIAGAVILLVIIAVFFSPNVERKKISQVCFSSKCVEVEIADDENERIQGLMFRTSLDENKGMLFVFDKSENYPFWMKNTFISLDMIWIDENFKVVYVAHATPCKRDPCEIYNPNKNAKYVIEVNEGFVEKNEVKVGDVVRINK